MKNNNENRTNLTEKEVSISMENIWDEAAIRKVLKKLDAKTRLKGATLPITFNKSKRILGSFYSAEGGAFRFSRYYLDDPNWPVEKILDTIRHEYAHYMDYMLYGNLGHGKTWKKCCTDIGAIPVRCCNSDIVKHYQDKHKAEQEKSKILDGYRAGSFIIHPVFGKGEIVEIAGSGVHRQAFVSFPDMETKKLSLAWIDKNCNFLPAFGYDTLDT